MSLRPAPQLAALLLALTASCGGEEGPSFATVPLPKNAFPSARYPVVGAGRDAMWLFDNGLHRWDGAAWTFVPLADSLNVSWIDGGAEGGALWLSGADTLAKVHADGTVEDHSDLVDGLTLVAAWGDAVLVVDDGGVWRLVGGQLEEAERPSQTLSAIRLLSPTQAYAIGDDPQGGPSLLVFDGAAWSARALPAGAALDSLFAGGEGDVWIRTAAGGAEWTAGARTTTPMQLVHWNGTAFEDVSLAPPADAAASETRRTELRDVIRLDDGGLAVLSGESVRPVSGGAFTLERVRLHRVEGTRVGSGETVLECPESCAVPWDVMPPLGDGTLPVLWHDELLLGSL